MIYHVLPGDAQVDEFRESGIDGEIVVCREAFVDGDLSGDDLDEFFINRAAHFNAAVDEDPAIYNANVASQFRKLTQLGEGDEVNLWFEYELFCAVNMWFCLDLLRPTKAEVYRIAPVYRVETDLWEGFGGSTSEDMRKCFDARVKLTNEDLELGAGLWNAFKSGDDKTLIELSKSLSPAFPHLAEVCRAAVERHERPLAIVRQLLLEGINGFQEIFGEFRRRAGVYGYGDIQVKRLLDDAR